MIQHAAESPSRLISSVCYSQGLPCVWGVCVWPRSPSQSLSGSVCQSELCVTGRLRGEEAGSRAGGGFHTVRQLLQPPPCLSTSVCTLNSQQAGLEAFCVRTLSLLFCFGQRCLIVFVEWCSFHSTKMELSGRECYFTDCFSPHFFSWIHLQ